MSDTVDYSRQTADSPEDDGIESLLRRIPGAKYWSPDLRKRFKDAFQDSQAATDTSVDENALLKQGREKGMKKLRSETNVPAAADYTPPKPGKNAGARFRGPSADPVFGAVGEGEELERDAGGALRLTRHQKF